MQMFAPYCRSQGGRVGSKVQMFAVYCLLALPALGPLPGCGPRPPVAAPAAPTPDGGWRTLRAEHKVTIRATGADGKTSERSLRGLLAVERPDRFRLRALGPGGITLFDVLSVAGRVKVVEAIRDVTKDPTLGEVVRSMAGDLAAAYDLAPRPPDRQVAVEGDAVVVREPGRTVRLSDFRAVGAERYPARVDIENDARHYRVTVESGETTLDEPLAPALFAE